MLKDGRKMGDSGVRAVSCPTWRALCTFVTSEVTGVKNHVWFDPPATAGLCIEVSIFPNKGYLIESKKKKK